MQQCTSLTDQLAGFAAGNIALAYLLAVGAIIAVIAAYTRLVRRIQEKENKCKFV
jgi:hypothetical protein